MMKNLLILTLFLLSSMAFSQATEIRGQVLDAEFNQEPLAFAEVKVQGLDIEAITDEKGNYKLELAPGSYNLEIAFIGYETRMVTTEIDVKAKQIRLQPIVLEGKRFGSDYSLSLSDHTEDSGRE